MATGVRSSWEAAATNRRSVANAVRMGPSARRVTSRVTSARAGDAQDGHDRDGPQQLLLLLLVELQPVDRLGEPLDGRVLVVARAA